jgi:predicted RNA-binding protein YlxR (DUF448 family)
MGCKQRRGKIALLRFTVGPGGPVLDLPQRAAGRGLYLCPRRACFEAAARRGPRALRRGRNSGGIDADLLVDQVMRALQLERDRLLEQGRRDGRIGGVGPKGRGGDVSDPALRRRLALVARQRANLGETS